MQPDRQRTFIRVYTYGVSDWVYNYKLTYTVITSKSIFTCTFWLKFIKKTRSTIVTGIANAWSIWYKKNKCYGKDCEKHIKTLEDLVVPFTCYNYLFTSLCQLLIQTNDYYKFFKMCIRNDKILIKVMSISIGRNKSKISYCYVPYVLSKKNKRTDTTVKYVKGKPISAVLILNEPCLYVFYLDFLAY